MTDSTPCSPSPRARDAARSLWVPLSAVLCITVGPAARADGATADHDAAAEVPGPCYGVDEAPRGVARGTGVQVCFWSVEQRRALRVRFLDGDPAVIARVKAVAARWTEHADVRFVWVDEGDAEIRVTFRTDGAWSKLGSCTWTNQEVPTMGLGIITSATSDVSLRRTVLHEMGHALGLEHEHQSAAAGIEIDPEPAYAWFAERFGWAREDVDKQVLERKSSERSLLGAWDPLSVMSYWIPASITKNGVEVPLNDDLSEGDKAFIAMLYPRIRAEVQARAQILGAGAVVLEVGDVDDDGVVDLVTRAADPAESLEVVLLDGLAVKGRLPLPGAPEGARLAAIAELDGEPGAELVWQRDRRAEPDFVVWSLGPDLRAAREWAVPDMPWRRFIAAGDVDGDGVGDLVVRDGVLRTETWLNDGHGVFARASSIDVVGGLAATSRSIDLDGDGLLDVLFDVPSGRSSWAWQRVGETFVAHYLGLVLPRDARLVDAGRLVDGPRTTYVLGRTPGVFEAWVVAKHRALAVVPLTEQGSDAVGARVTDLDGDGRAEILTWHADGHVNVHRLIEGQRRGDADETVVESPVASAGGS